MTEYFSCAALIPDNGIRTLLDKGVRVMFDTQELLPEDAAKLFSLKGSYGQLYFSPAPIDKEVKAPEESRDFKGEKSPAQVLRNRMFVSYQKRKGTDTGFNQWYADQLEEIGKKYLDKLP